MLSASLGMAGRVAGGRESGSPEGRCSRRQAAGIAGGPPDNAPSNPPPMNLPDHTWIETADRLPALGAAIAAAPWVALDTEANSMFVYREQVCLLQLNVAGALYMVDTLAIARAGG